MVWFVSVALFQKPLDVFTTKHGSESDFLTALALLGSKPLYWKAPKPPPHSRNTALPLSHHGQAQQTNLITFQSDPWMCSPTNRCVWRALLTPTSILLWRTKGCFHFSKQQLALTRIQFPEWVTLGCVHLPTCPEKHITHITRILLWRSPRGLLSFSCFCNSTSWHLLGSSPHLFSPTKPTFCQAKKPNSNLPLTDHTLLQPPGICKKWYQPLWESKKPKEGDGTQRAIKGLHWFHTKLNQPCSHLPRP